MVSVLNLSSSGERPYERLDELRESAPVHVIDEPPRGRLFLRHEYVSRALVDKNLTLDANVVGLQRVTGGRRRADELDWFGHGALVEGTRTASALRQIALQTLSRRGLQRSRLFVEGIVETTINGIRNSESIDLYADYGLPVAAGCLFQILDADCPVASELVEHAHNFIYLASPIRSLRDSIRVHRSIRWFRQYLQEVLMLPDRHGDLLRNLTKAHLGQDGEGPCVDEDDVVRFCVELIAAGVHTVATAIVQSLLHYYGDDEARSAFPQESDKMSDWIAESLRIESFVLFLVRFVREGVKYDDVELDPGDVIWLSPAAANRDPRVFDRPTTFDPARNSSKSLVFGRGSHHCLGTDLAFLEASTAVLSFVYAFPNASLLGPIEWGGDILARTPVKVRVKL